MIAFTDVAVSHGASNVLRAVSGEIARGGTLALLGPSGAGKTTLLHALAGFIGVTNGSIRMDGRVVSEPGRTEPPELRSVGVVFQHNALWPHLTVLENVAYPCRRAGMERLEAETIAAELLETLGIADLAHRTPDTISGGQQQRVGVARAIARRPSLFLLDEPTAHLDAPLRTEVLAAIRHAQSHTEAAMVIATHDPTEALAIADVVMVLRAGSVVQIGRPHEVYTRPVDEWTARTTGPVSCLPLPPPTPNGTRIIGSLELHPAPETGVVLVRPEWVALGEGTDFGTVTERWYRGGYVDHTIETETGALLARTHDSVIHQPGSMVRWSLRQAWAVVRGT